MPKEEKTAAEIQAEQEAAARARGDIIDGDNPPGDLVGEADDEEEEEEIVDIEGDEEEEEDDDDSPILEDEEDEEDEPEKLTIPKARFDEAQRKARLRQEELEQKIATYEQKSSEAAVQTDTSKLATEIEDLSTQYEDLLLEGELEKARKVRVERDRKQNEMFDQRLQQQSQITGTAAVEQMRFDAQLAQFEAKFPAINPDSDSFDQETTSEVNTLLNAFKAGGFTHTAALNKAVHYVFQGAETPVVGNDPEVVRSKRSQQARRRVAKVAKKSPPSLRDKGRDSDKSGSGDGLPDVTKLTPEQFDKLSEADLRKMRADTLTDEAGA